MADTDQSGGRLDAKTLTIAVLAMTTAGSLAAAGYFYSRAEAAEKRLAPFDEMAARMEAKARKEAAAADDLAREKKKVEAQMREQQAKIEGLLTQLASAKDEATRISVQKQLEEARQQQRKITSGGAPAWKPGCACIAGDPLCSCD